jgi:hypothetical protein
MPRQSEWRFCQECHGLFFNGNAKKGSCPTSKGHQAQGLDFVLPHDLPSTATAQDRWRLCGKCNLMFYEGYTGGSCPAGGSHEANGAVFTLPHSIAPTASSQGNWRYCDKCHAMFFNGDGGGRCATGGQHRAQGLIFVLPHGGANGWAAPHEQIKWNGVTLPQLSSQLVSEFAAAFRRAAANSVPDNWLLKIDATIRSDPKGFKTAYGAGVLTGILAGLKGLVDSLESIGAVPLKLYFGSDNIEHGRFMLTNAAQIELRKRQLHQAKIIARVSSASIEDIALNPGDYVDMSVEMGTGLGIQAGEWFTSEFVNKTAPELGKTIGLIVGQITFELILFIIFEFTTAGLGEAARGAMVVGDGTKGGTRFAAILERLKGLLRRMKGVQRVARAMEAETKAVEVAKTIRPRATIADLLRMDKEEGWFSWGTFRENAVKNETVSYTGENTTKGSMNTLAPEQVYLIDGLKPGFGRPDYGPYRVAVRNGEHVRVRQLSVGEWGVDEIPASKGFWYTKDDLKAAGLIPKD